MASGDFPFDPPAAPPSPGRMLFELLAPRESLRLPARLPGLLRRRAGRLETVLLVPGLGATDASMLPLRTFLRRLGHDARSVGFGRITGDVEGQMIRLGELASKTSKEIGRPIALVGWSIGGVLSREAARDHPLAISRIITFGTPVVGGPAFSQVARRYDAATIKSIADTVEERNRDLLQVPVTAMWSRIDGVVAPSACFDRATPGAEHVEVRSSHFGMGIDPDVWRVIADRLAAEPGRPTP